MTQRPFLSSSLAVEEYVSRLENENLKLKEDVKFLTDRLLDRADTLFKLGVELADTRRELEKYRNAVL